MFIRKMLGVSLLITALMAMVAFPACAAEDKKSNAIDSSPVKLVMDSEYIDGKVNDPVSKKTKKAYIVCDNAEFHFESTTGALDRVTAVFYINEYLDGQDKGIHTRVVKKTIDMKESVNLLPDDMYEDMVEDGSAYDFINRCYDVRVYTSEDESKYIDFYFGLVNDAIYSNMYEDMEMKQEALEEAAAAKAPKVDDSIAPSVRA